MAIEGFSQNNTAENIDLEVSEQTKKAYMAVMLDIRSLPPSNIILKYKMGDNIKLAINSANEVSYEVLDAQKGYYLISKTSYDNTTPTGPEPVVVLSNQPVIQENPDFIVCSAEELENWLHGGMDRKEVWTKKETS